jgi:predicted HTH domain antitoxin
MCDDENAPPITEAVEDEEEMIRDLANRRGVMLAEYEKRMETAGIKEINEQIEVVDPDHSITLRKAAEIAGVSYVDMLELAADAGVEVGYTIDDLKRDLNCLDESEELD